MRILVNHAGRFAQLSDDGPWVPMPGTPAGSPSSCCSGAEDPAVWGPPMWRELHGGQALPPYFASRIPCEECRAHFVAYVAEKPPPVGDGFKQWAIDLHNAMNVRLGKPKWVG